MGILESEGLYVFQKKKIDQHIIIEVRDLKYFYGVLAILGVALPYMTFIP
ncbi:hypothetical protein ABIE27_003711 [Paenibacillus sp. 4624]